MTAPTVYDWKTLMRIARSPEAKADVLTWDALPSLWDLLEVGGQLPKWTDTEVSGNSDCHAVALRYLYDIRRCDLVRVQSDFMRSMVERAETWHSLTPAMVRGVLNVLTGRIRGHRRRFRKSRLTRRDRQGGDENCMVCGGPLTTPVAVARGIGDTCYRRVMGDW